MREKFHIALYQPEIAQNTGTLLRTGACLGAVVHIIFPCGFALSDSKLKRSGMDYVDLVEYHLHDSWEDFQTFVAQHKLNLVLIDAKGETSAYAHPYQKGEVYLLGQESKGIPESVKETCPKSLFIPMIPQARSLNVAVSGAIILSQALSKTS